MEQRLQPAEADSAENSTAKSTPELLQSIPWLALGLSLGLNALLLALWMADRSGLLPRDGNAASGAAPSPAASAAGESETGLNPERLMEQVNPVAGFNLHAHYGDLGPRLIQAGAIDLDRFEEVFQQAGRPLTADQLTALLSGSDAPVVINRENGHFLLNFFWALGLANRSPLLEDGPLMSYSEGDIGRFASTGGWTLGARPATDLYSSANILELTPQQHDLVEQVASQVYRPCCDNPAAFPDCNHGMALLGLLQLLASQGASEGEMLMAAKYANSFWFPQQAMEMAAFFFLKQGLTYEQVAASDAVGRENFSGTGFNDLHRWLADNGLLQEAPSQGGSCSV
jgi:hypothetical protein